MKKILLLVLLVSITGTVKGQNGTNGSYRPVSSFDTVSLRQSAMGSSSYEYINIPVTTVSPNAASLGLFGAIPVGHYTGIPNISIPIYEIEMDGKKFPVNISYHASGIKVAQEASTTGLGWALNAGGCITKEIRGWDDFGAFPKGYFFDTDFPPVGANNNLNISTGNADKWKYDLYQTNASDPEPDLFHFNFSSFSGSMFIKRRSTPGQSATDPKAVIQKETAYLDATYYISNINSYWVVSDGDGFKYYFGTRESSETFFYSRSYYDDNNPLPPRTYFTHNPIQFEDEITTAWYLDSIVSPKNNKIIFSYQKDKVYTPISASEDVSYMLDRHEERPPGTGYAGSTLLGSYAFYNYSYAKVEQALLTGISFPCGQITLSYGNRLDLESAIAGQNARKLESIAISNTNQNLKNVILKHSYSGNTISPLSCRLMLDTLRIGNGTDALKYVFSYNQSEFPPKTSFASDYWGYYNNSTTPRTPFDSRTFRFTAPVIATSDRGKKLIPGRDKQSKENEMQFGILTSIRYPTGGKTAFEYEMHQFQNSFNAYEKSIIKQLARHYFGNFEEISEDFVISEQTESMIDLSNYGYCYGATPSISAYIERKQGTNYQIVKTLSISTGSVDNAYSFLPGTYRIRTTATGINCDMDVKFIVSTLVPKTIHSGGGLRIKAIRDEVDNTHSIRREFSYQKSGNTSGLLMTDPRYYCYYVLANQPYSVSGGGVIDMWYIALYLNGFSSPYTPFGNSAMGGNIGYSYVEEKTTDSGEDNGRIAYTFINKADASINLSDRFIKGYPAIPCLSNGYPLEISYLDKNMNPKKKEKFEYVKIKTDSIKGLKVYKLPMVTSDMSIKFYDLYSERWALDKKIDSLFFNNQTVMSKTEYQYNQANWLVNAEKTYGSSNEIIEKKLKYPSDFNSAEPYATMVNRKILSPVIEESEYKNNSFLQKTVTDYKNWGNNIFAPEFIKLQATPSSSLETRLTYHNRDSKGNPVYLSKDDATKLFYVWGYKGQYPIAEIQMGDYTFAQVEAAVKSVFSVANLDILSQQETPNETALTNGSLQNALSKALVTTYTYKPLVGIRKMQDPRKIVTEYLYDDLGRLKQVLVDGKKESEYQYHYKE